MAGVIWPTRDELEQSPLYSETLDIDLGRRANREYFKWFIASVLFGARISETIAARTYRALERRTLLAPRRIISAGWDFLVNPIMREGGYVRYDGRKSTQLLEDCRHLIDEYGSSLLRLHAVARDREDLEQRMLGFYGIGPTTMNIFLRELRPYWEKADPEPLPVVAKIARRAGIDLHRYERKSLVFARVEAGLLRLRRQLKRSSTSPHPRPRLVHTAY
jgi:hypothetical protein